MIRTNTDMELSRFVPETLRWLIVNGKDDEVKKWIATAAKCNGVSVDIEQLYETADCETQSGPSKIKPRNLFNIFKSKILALQAIVMCYLW